MFFIIFFYYVIQYFFERCCSFFFLSEKEIQQLLESVIRPLIQNETCIPKKRTDYKKYCIDLYFHGYSVGCCTDMNDVLLKREKQLIKHIGTCVVAPSTITSFKSDDLLNRLFNVSPVSESSEFICNFGGVLYLSRDKENDNDFFGFPERAFKISTQTFERWRFTIL